MSPALQYNATMKYEDWMRGSILAFESNIKLCAKQAILGPLELSDVKISTISPFLIGVIIGTILLLIFSHDGKYCYLVNEISNSIMVYQYHDGHFTLIQVIHCVPRHFHGFSSAAAIHMTSSGKHIIVSNRGHDSIVLYRVNQETGKITLLYMVHTGKGPRDFNIIDDRYIVVASQEEDFLELYTFDEEKEEIKPTGNTLDIIQPVCVAL